MAPDLKINSGIYKITNIGNSKIYIGCASNIITRINGHKYDLRKRKHPNNYLQNAWNKYGENLFTFEILEKCEIINLHSREHYWVNELKSLDRNFGYNLKPTDPNGCSIHSEETIQKMKYSMKGRKKSQACIDAIKIYNSSEEAKLNLKKAREKLKFIDFYKVNSNKRKSVKNLLTDEIYTSVTEASKILNIPKYELSRKLSGKRKNNTNLIYL
jgi:group I intron endonuclease